jgi:hypothetical protein
MRSGPALLLVAGVLLVGCGGRKAAPPTPTLPHAVAQRLLGALDDPARLQALAIQEVNAHRIPPGLQEPLLSRVNAFHADPSAGRRAELERWLRDRSG